jgi:IS30 family transposase
MGRGYAHLDLAERRRIATLLEARVPVSAMAAELGRHRSTIHREIARNFSHTGFRDRWGQDYRGYYAVAGHGMAQRRRTSQAKLLRYPGLRAHIVARLRDGWSPQQIAGRLKHDMHPEGYASHETIYQHVYGSCGRAARLYTLLTTARRQRRRRFGRKPRATPIPLERSITARPAHIACRREFGHWEGDLMIFARRLGSTNVMSLQERRSRFVMLVGNDDKRASTITRGIDAQLAPLPSEARRTITLDRGTEFLDYPAFPIKAWFCDPHSPWQKGGIENANGRLRRFLPLDSTAGERSAAALSALADKLNATPRRCLNYRTPNEVFAEALSMITPSA